MSLKIHKGLGTIGKICFWILIVIIAGCLLKVFIWENQYYADKTISKRAQSNPTITELGVAVSPSEIQPSATDIESHQVEADEPRYLSIERLDVERACIFASEVDESKLPMPDNIFELTWFAGSAKPGHNGFTLIGGISSGATMPGAFAGLDSLEQNDKITIELGNGDLYTYLVQEVRLVAGNQSAAELPSVQQKYDDQETLVLVTGLKSAADVSAYGSIAMVRATLQQNH